MPSIKIYPPTPLPDRGVSETSFNIWIEELEVYLGQEKDFEVFLKDGAYEKWESYETNPNRIPALKNEAVAEAGATAEEIAEVQTQNEEKLKAIRKSLRTALSIVGKCVSQGHYNSVIRHSTSLQWIYDTLKCDYNIESKGIHFFNILDVKYDPSVSTPVAFYNQYRTAVSNNLAKTGDIIKYKSNDALTQDERMTPMLEDIILLDVIREIDARLPNFVRTHYNHKLKKDERLMDVKSDILVNIPTFLEQMDSTENNSMKEDISLKAFKPSQFSRSNTKKNYRQKTAQQVKFCRVCKLANLPREIYMEHNVGDPKCTSLSSQDKQRLLESAKLSFIREEEESPEVDEDEVAEMYGYPAVSNDFEKLSVEVKDCGHTNTNDSRTDLSRTNPPTCGYIKPVPSQILTVYQNIANEDPVHIDLDSGASVNFCTEKEARRRGFKIYPNGQLCKLGDGVTNLKGIGEINEVFFRNSWTVKFRAIVCKQLTSPFIGGTLFLQENGIQQDFVRNVIHVHQKKESVLPTDPISLLSTAPLCASTTKVKENSASESTKNFSRRVLLPGQEVAVSVDKKDGTEVCVEPGLHNIKTWPQSQLRTVSNGKIYLRNSEIDPIFLGKDVKSCQIRDTEAPKDEDKSYYNYQPTNSNISTEEVIDNTTLIKQGNIQSEDTKRILDDAHSKFSDVFDKDLTKGYNHFYGQHKCHLNWATAERPSASKVRVPCYDHDLKVLQQELMDDLTEQNVLLVPQDHNIKVESVCPSFIQRKKRGKDKPKDKLTKDDVRLIINFGPVNDKIKPLPNRVPKTEDILTMLGRWNHIIIFDLHSGYFQCHMSEDAIPWLGVQTPFGGLRVISRSGQGLLGQAEEFEELISKVLKQELQDGICAKIVDDVIVGGDTQEEAAKNYVRILSKLHNANLKIAPEKTSIFPKEADILGWVWKEGGKLEASPHRKLALTNTKTEDIKKVQDMRSWVGLFKTLHIVTPQISNILAPFEEAAAGKDSKEPFVWNFELEKKFREAKQSIDSLVTLYLPSPQDQLILETDAARGGGKQNLPAGIGHVLYAVKGDKKVPVRYHSAKLPDKCKKWSPCEIEALALAAGVNREYDIIRESKYPLIIQPDSKPVHEAIKLINNGKFSSSARMSSFLTNINRTRIDSKHISGKAKLNPVSDLQSRNPSECSSEFCSIHRFIDETIDSVIDGNAKLDHISEATGNGFTNRLSWKSAQESNQACLIAKQLLTSGKLPPKAVGKTSGEYWNDVRQYHRDASISKDGLLVVKSQPNVISGNIPRDRIVVPKPLVPALLYHTHNHNDQHPAKTQQKSLFQRQFYAIGLDKHLDLLYQNCYKCSVVQKLPKEIIPNETKTNVDSPQTHFHADVIKRASQNILTIRDHFSSFQDAIIIPNETSKELKEGLIIMTSAMRRPAEIYISVDNAPGFKSLLPNTDEDFKKLKIVMVKTDELNKNSNAVIDKGCQELEQEIKQLEPEGAKLTISTLKQAVLNLNSKLRRRGNISAYEINSARDQNTGDNLQLNDKILRGDQVDKRKDKNSTKENDDIEVGDTVRIKNKSDKHIANEIFLVTSKNETNVGVQKLLHPLKSKPKLMSKIYNTRQKHLVTIHRPKLPEEEHEPDLYQYIKNNNDEKKSFKAKPWNPINTKFFNDDSDSDEVEEKPKTIIENRNETGDELEAENNNVYEAEEEENNDVVENHDEETENNLTENEENINNQLVWDSSPEQYEHHGNNEELEDAIQSRRLFEEERSDLTEETSDDEVFERNDFKTPPTTPKLKRNNAMRKGRRPIKSNSEPRVTRNMLQSGSYRASISNPTSPSQVVLNERQNLENILVPNHPILPELVDLAPVVQNLDQALQNVNVDNPRRSTRNKGKEKHFYKKLNDRYGKFGDKE